MSTTALKIDPSFGQKLKSLRESRGYTQEQLAHKIGLTGRSAAYICRIESAIHYPRLDRLKRIAEVLQVSMESLLS